MRPYFKLRLSPNIFVMSFQLYHSLISNLSTILVDLFIKSFSAIYFLKVKVLGIYKNI